MADSIEIGNVQRRPVDVPQKSKSAIEVGSRESGGKSPRWGMIIGNILDQLDLIAKFFTKADKVSGATSGNFAALDSEGNLNDSGKKSSDFATAAQGAKADTALQQHQDISGKADKVTSATSGNLAGLDSNGNLTDSGKKAADFATAAQGAKADSALQQHQDISGKANKVTGATSGNFASLDSNGDLQDSGHKHSDYAAASHTHTKSDITDFSHTHSASDVTDLSKSSVGLGNVLNKEQVTTDGTSQTIIGTKTFQSLVADLLLKIVNSSGGDVSLELVRGGTSDDLTDWRIRNSSGVLYIENRDTSTTSDQWVERFNISRNALNGGIIFSPRFSPIAYHNIINSSGAWYRIYKFNSYSEPFSCFISSEWNNYKPQVVKIDVGFGCWYGSTFYGFVDIKNSENSSTSIFKKVRVTGSSYNDCSVEIYIQDYYSGSNGEACILRIVSGTGTPYAFTAGSAGTNSKEYTIS